MVPFRTIGTHSPSMTYTLSYEDRIEFALQAVLASGLNAKGWPALSLRSAAEQFGVSHCYGFSFFLTSYVTLTTLTFPSTAQLVHLFLSHLYNFALLFTAMRIASLFLFHHSYVFFPSSYAVPLGLCAFSCSINILSVLM